MIDDIGFGEFGEFGVDVEVEVGLEAEEVALAVRLCAQDVRYSIVTPAPDALTPESRFPSPKPDQVAFDRVSWA